MSEWLIYNALDIKKTIKIQKLGFYTLCLKQVKIRLVHCGRIKKKKKETAANFQLQMLKQIP